MAYEFKFPFEPPWEDLREQGVTESGCQYYIFDSCVERDPEKKKEINRNIAAIIARSERRKFLEQLAAEDK